MANGVYMYVIQAKFNNEWWSTSLQTRRNILNRIEELEARSKNDLVALKRFISLRYDGHLLYWVSDFDTSKLNNLRYSLISSGEGFLEEKLTLFSYFKPSPYIGGSADKLASYLRLEPLRYFIAYPMKKSPEWYLLPFEERKEIMDEHIEIAKTHPDNQGIRSYTTYSFGIADYEFVVIYEAPDLSKWINVVERLREAKARKWVVSEEPILVGEIGSLDIFLK
ncbi:chlorite dismutase family protein [Sulfolobus acidocaldarius]|uniref:Conserved Archaeal protein n=4 Tax=Sulfolobus acidocaldarius TaxID=2285 RepID=Q4JCN7_SULAC|nr:chlorite dismutase family protein [Sulfolobus acidocaldarius]AAY79442.1 conserved Archaeal protein [Sulfolobus acidocaldarius DSM 639]AGE69993.1 hypothetical protein SacN8_00060 [Sulfolobus acidocaldarius N8]AGE72268.1 hypothetical protein SacRon12I_00060 [Sulfolobus acidocaldarius Ron12/I]ALU29575.1 chlorite dismutase [Sulfolobus acidocaldarius]ALU32306.1 chlorite dismutase [Sulfolobus acidocaldarius]